MTGIVIAGHGNFASGVMSAIELVAGIPEQFACVDFEKGQDVAELKEGLLSAIRSMEGEQVLLLVDILGGSPFNTAAQLLLEDTGKQLKVIAGMNMAAVVQAVFMREMISFEDLPAQVLAAGKEGMVDVSAMMNGV